MVCFFTLPVFAVHAADDEMLAVEVGDPVLVAEYTGAETIANMQGYHFCGLIRAGNGNLIGLYGLRADWCTPEEYDLREYVRNEGGACHISTDNGRTWSPYRPNIRTALKCCQNKNFCRSPSA